MPQQKRAPRTALAALIAATLVAPASRARADTYYVSTTGNDASSGTTTNAPFKSVTKALSVVNPGDTIYVRPGTYSGAHLAARSGTAESPIRLIGDSDGAIFGTPGVVTLSWNPRDALVITADYFELHNIRITSTRIGVTWTNVVGGRMVGCTLESCHHMNMLANGSEVSVEKSEIREARGPGITVGSGSILTISDSKVLVSSHDGIVVSTGGRAEILRCNISNNRQDGVDVQGGSARIVSCLVSANSNSGVSISTGGSATLEVWNSTVVSNRNSGVNAPAGSSVVRNCILTGNSNYGITTSASMDASYNLFYANKSGVVKGIALSATDIVADPLFDDKTLYTLDPASPAINAGVSPGVPVTLDLVGMPRPGGGRYDLGAYESDAPVEPTAIPVRVVRWREVGATESE